MREQVISEETKQRIVESQVGYTYVDEERSKTQSPKVSADGSKKPMSVADAESSQEKEDWIETPDGDKIRTLEQAFKHIVENA